MSRHTASLVPRPEHPRPDLHRGLHPGVDWLNLNGPWGFAFDSQDLGLREGWAEGDEERFTRTIIVPFPWESHLAWGTEAEAGNRNWFAREVYLDPDSVTLDNYREAPRHTIGWYRRVFPTPVDWTNRRVFLNIGAADWELRAWVNGVEVGAAESGYLPLSFDITDALTDGENTLVIRVHDPADHSRQPIGKQVSNWYTRTSGIWQTVWLEPRPATHLADVRVAPNLAAGRAMIRAEVVGEAQGLQVTGEVRSAAGRTVAHVGPTVVGADGTAHLIAELPDAIPWTPKAPHMYRLTVDLLADGEAVDRVHTQFGMRDIDTGPLGPDGPTYIRLNGRPVYLRGALDQSFHPQGVYAFPSDAALKRDLVLAKQAGLNFLRLHIKTPDPRYCYWADRVGILLMCDMPSLGYDGYSEEGKQRWERTAWGQIRRDFNHPSIVAWCLFNESWGLGGREYAERPDRQAWVRECWETAKALDPTRLVEDNSPCLYDHVVTDINSWHFYINDYERARDHLAEVVANTYPGSTFNFVGGNTQGNQPLLNSEYGGISARMGDLDVSWCLLFLTNELRKHERVCGYVYTELTDIEWECNGLYNYDRSAKEFGYDPALLLGAEFIGFNCAPGLSVAAGERVHLPVFLRPSAAAESLAARGWWSASLTDALGRQRRLVPRAPLGDLPADGGALELVAPDEPGLVRVYAEIDDGRGGVSAMNLRFVEVRGPVVDAREIDDALVLTLTPGAGEARFEGEVERGIVEGEVQLLAGQGDGEVIYCFTLPEGTQPAEIASIEVVTELSSARPGAPQTEAERWPSEVAISIGGHGASRVELANQPADTRGALSHMHGLLGRYGELVVAKVTGERARGAVCEGAVEVRLQGTGADLGRGGLTIYGARAGRYPVGVTLVLRIR